MTERETTDEIVQRRFGRNHDKPCANPNMLTCATWECQVKGRCRLGRPAICDQPHPRVVQIYPSAPSGGKR